METTELLCLFQVHLVLLILFVWWLIERRLVKMKEMCERANAAVISQFEALSKRLEDNTRELQGTTEALHTKIETLEKSQSDNQVSFVSATNEMTMQLKAVLGEQQIIQKVFKTLEDRETQLIDGADAHITALANVKGTFENSARIFKEMEKQLDSSSGIIQLLKLLLLDSLVQKEKAETHRVRH